MLKLNKFQLGMNLFHEFYIYKMSWHIKYVKYEGSQ